MQLAATVGEAGEAPAADPLDLADNPGGGTIFRMTVPGAAAPLAAELMQISAAGDEAAS